MLTRIKIYFQLLINQSVSKTSETNHKQADIYRNKNSSAFLQKILGHHHHFPWLSMTLAVFHDFPGLENGLTKFHDFPGRVVTLRSMVDIHPATAEIRQGKKEERRQKKPQRKNIIACPILSGGHNSTHDFYQKWRSTCTYVVLRCGIIMCHICEIWRSHTLVSC